MLDDKELKMDHDSEIDQDAETDQDCLDLATKLLRSDSDRAPARPVSLTPCVSRAPAGTKDHSARRSNSRSPGRIERKLLRRTLLFLPGFSQYGFGLPTFIASCYRLEQVFRLSTRYRHNCRHWAHCSRRRHFVERFNGLRSLPKVQSSANNRPLIWDVIFEEDRFRSDPPRFVGTGLRSKKLFERCVLLNGDSDQ